MIIIELTRVLKHMGTAVWHLQRHAGGDIRSMDYDQLYIELEQLEQDIELVRDWAVEQQRKTGASWERIAKDLGKSRQSVWKRYANVDQQRAKLGYTNPMPMTGDVIR